MSEKLSGGEMLIRALQDEGVEYIFGYPGGSALHIYDAIFRQQKVDHILVRHEQAATHMADGYARATGKPGVVLVTSGPGATNAITGLATAYMDSIPMVVISGQVPTNLIGSDAFQETDMIGVSRPVVKHSFMVKAAEDIPEIVRKAFYIATTGRPGPVVIDVPKDTTDPAVLADYVYPGEVRLRSYNPAQRGHSGQIRKAADLLLAAQRPVLYVGGGAVQGEAQESLRALAQRMNTPVTSTLMGLGAYPCSDRQHLGMLGMHGTYEANNAMHHADLIIAVGARFDDRVTNDPSKFCPDAKIVHVDIDPASVAKIVPVDVPIVGPAKQVMDDLLADVTAQLDANPALFSAEQLTSWWEQIEHWRERHGLSMDQRDRQKPEGPILPQVAMQALYKATKGRAYVSSDVGQHQMFTAQYYHFDEPRRWINSGGLGTMGFGLPAAMGVQFALADETVVCVTGEGSFMMNVQELSTCKQYALPIKVVCLNNQALGMVKQWQDMQYGGRHSQSTYQDSLPGFVELAEAFGHVGFRITHPDDLEPTLNRVFSDEFKDRLVFVDIAVDPEEHVYPMAVRGGSMRDMFLSKTEQT